MHIALRYLESSIQNFAYLRLYNLQSYRFRANFSLVNMVFEATYFLLEQKG